MKATNHRLHKDDGTPVPFERSPNQSSGLEPRYLVMHYTAGSSAKGSINHFKKREAKASAHLVIGRDGSITQMVAFDRVAWHAGRSRWLGLSGLNRYSIGIELDNAGALDGGPGDWRAWFGGRYDDEDVVVATHKFEEVECGWHRFTEAQLAAALEAAAAIVARYDLIDVLGHDDIAPERKRDPGPAFPMDSFRGRLVGRRDDDFPILATTTALNIREGPGVQFEKLSISPLAKGTRLNSEMREGTWHFVEVLDEQGEPEATGWVHGNFIASLPRDTT